MEENKIYDAFGNEIVVKEEDFVLLENHQKLSDVKFETKATTFAKDAFKRFCKNKSSVVAAFIIGLLLVLSVFVPIISPYDVSSASYPTQSLLSPKLFKAGTGFWDGTDEYKNQIYDFERKQVGDGTSFLDQHIYNLKLSEMGEISTAVTGAHYGTLIFAQNSTVTGNAEDSVSRYYNYNFVEANSAYPINFEVKFDNTNNVFSGYVLGSYKIFVETYADDASVLSPAVNKYYVSDTWSKNYNDTTINVTNILAENGVTGTTKVRVGFELLPSTNANETAYIGLKSFVLSTTAANAPEEYKTNLATLSVTDANEQVLLNRDGAGVYPTNFWMPTIADRRVYKAQIQYATFDYDKYGLKFGDVSMEISTNSLNEYIENGWLTFDMDSLAEGEYDPTTGLFVGDIVYTINSEDCPIVSINSIRETVLGPGDVIYTISGVVTYYKYMGYDSMPKFLLGTTDQGYDLLTLAFTSLRTSLALALVVSAINFMIGLCWGSVSGYFGGNIDLVMERITDILSGMPFIVVVTLCILHLGNSVLTFGIALCLTGWIGTAARTRTQFYRFRGREYVLASRTLGASNKRLIFKHILPNALGTIVTGAVLMIPSVIFSEATLAYLNLGLQGSASFGVLLSDSQKYLSTFPVLIVFPAIIISLLMISFNLFGNGLRDALNPSLKGSD